MLESAIVHAGIAAQVAPQRLLLSGVCGHHNLYSLSSSPMAEYRRRQQSSPAHSSLLGLHGSPSVRPGQVCLAACRILTPFCTLGARCPNFISLCLPHSSCMAASLAFTWVFELATGLALLPDLTRSSAHILQVQLCDLQTIQGSEGRAGARVPCGDRHAVAAFRHRHAQGVHRVR